jgi:AraC-like DNA-binding protein
MDVLSEVLSDLRMESTLYAVVEGASPWTVAYSNPELAGFHVVTEGRCVLEMDGAAPVALSAGDFVVLPHGTPHRLRCAAGGGPPVPIEQLGAACEAGSYPTLSTGGGGEVTRYLCGAFRFHEPHSSPVLAALPPLIHVRSENGKLLPWIELHLSFLACEAGSGRPGGQMVVARLSDVLFVQAIRAHLADLAEDAGGWLGAARDPQIGRALWLMHRGPEREWTVGALAAAVFMSRSAFAERFARLVGQPPLGYLSAWRMHLAARMLRGENARLAAVADRLGYGSEAAFSTAFRRRYGTSPGAYRRAAG